MGERPDGHVPSWTPSFLYACAARLLTVLIEIPNSKAIISCVMPRALRSSQVAFVKDDWRFESCLIRPLDPLVV